MGLFSSLPPMSGRVPLPVDRRAFETAAGEPPQSWRFDPMALDGAVKTSVRTPRLEVVK